tara:strand:- start:1701 stop:2213 length:513 start_codon:yes stop_codon:yes gene_type:complete
MKFTTRVMVLEKRRRRNEKMTNDLPNSPSTGGDPDEFDDEEGKMDAADAGLDTDEDTSRKVPKPGAKVTQGGNVNPDGSNKTTSDRDDKEDFRDDDRPINASKKTKKKVNAMKEQDKDKDWIQKAVDPDHEGYCTPMTKSTCTPKRKALAKTFKKMGRKRDRETKAKDEK